jgi:hypothetical protein
MSLYEQILAIYPILTVSDFQFEGTIKLQNDSDGKGDYIAKWDHLNLTRPTDEQLATPTGEGL